MYVEWRGWNVEDTHTKLEIVLEQSRACSIHALYLSRLLLAVTGIARSRRRASARRGEAPLVQIYYIYRDSNRLARAAFFAFCCY